MKETTLEQFARDPHGFLEAAQQERVLVTHHGKPLAVVTGVENKAEEDFDLEVSPDFWRMIEDRRRRPTVSLKDVEAALFAEQPLE
jgi:prevent-host-death family protein